MEETPTEGEKKTTEPGQEDLIKNMKAEFDRKLTNQQETTNAQLQALLAANEGLKNQLDTITETKVEPKPSDDLWYENANKAAQNLEDKIYKKINDQQAQTQATNEAQRQTFSQLTNEFPELKVGGSDLLVKAEQEFTKYSPAQQNDPSVMQAVVYKTAMELGLKPKSKRTENEEFVASGQKGSQTGALKKGDELDAKTIEFARLMNQNVEDDKYLDRLKKHSNRQWLKYQ